MIGKCEGELKAGYYYAKATAASFGFDDEIPEPLFGGEVCHGWVVYRTFIAKDPDNYDEEAMPEGNSQIAFLETEELADILLRALTGITDPNFKFEPGEDYGPLPSHEDDEEELSVSREFA